MKISVALCTYNGETYLTKQIESILRQSVPVQEIIITDDNSKDDTINLIKSFQQLYPEIIRLEVNKPGLGAKKNFERALSLCTGEIIFLSDQDDIWMDDKVERIIKKFEDEPAIEAVFTDALFINSAGDTQEGTLFEKFHFGVKAQIEWAKGSGAVEDLLVGFNRITGATLAIRKSLLARAFPFHLPKFFWHDAWLGVNAALKGSLSWINVPLTKYRLHENQQVGVAKSFLGLDDNASLRSLLVSMKQMEGDLLFVTDQLISKYKSDQLLDIRKKRTKAIQIIDYRLNLPNNILKRSLTVLSHLDMYPGTLKKSFRSVIRDIVKPA